MRMCGVMGGGLLRIDSRLTGRNGAEIQTRRRQKRDGKNKSKKHYEPHVHRVILLCESAPNSTSVPQNVPWIFTAAPSSDSDTRPDRAKILFSLASVHSYR